jgi:hypothetical protein
MQHFVAFPAKNDQIGLSVVTKSAAPCHVVNIEILSASTSLATPTVAFQDFSVQPRVNLRRLSNSGPFLRNRIIHSVLLPFKLAARGLHTAYRRKLVRYFVPVFPSPK